MRQTTAVKDFFRKDCVNRKRDKGIMFSLFFSLYIRQLKSKYARIFTIHPPVVRDDYMVKKTLLSITFKPCELKKVHEINV